MANTTFNGGGLRIRAKKNKLKGPRGKKSSQRRDVFIPHNIIAKNENIRKKEKKNVLIVMAFV